MRQAELKLTGLTLQRLLIHGLTRLLQGIHVADLGKRGRRKRYIIGLALAAWLATTGANAGEFVPATVANVSLKAPGGYYEQELYEITPTAPSALRARITLSKFEDNRDWATSFHFAVLNGDAYLGFQITRTDSGRLMTYFRKYQKGNDRAVLDFDFVPREGQAFTLLMEWTPKGKVTAAVGRDDQMERHEAELGLPPEKLRIIASGGSLDITPLELGNMTAITSSVRPPAAFRPSSAPHPAIAQAVPKPCAVAVYGAAACQLRR